MPNADVASTARKAMHKALEAADRGATRRALADQVDLLQRKFVALGMAADGMTMFTAAAGNLMQHVASDKS